MNDLTIIYLTASLIPESWAKFQRETLLKAIGDTKLISVSRQPLGFGINILDNGQKCTDNIYKQMLRASKLADTKYIAIAEDDTLYHELHFKLRPSSDDTFAYNKNRFTLFTWGEPIYHWRNRLSNCSLIAPRELLIEALEERFIKYPNGIPEKLVGELGRGMVERNLGVKERKCEELFSHISVIQINHDFSSEDRQRSHRKSLGPIRAYDIPYWGEAKELIEVFN
jgi:hypothetical protein